MKQSLDIGKANTLKQLLEAGFPVPPFLIVTSDELESAATRGIEGLATFTGELVRREADFFSHHQHFAVRSSADNEDGLSASMAGLYRTKLNVDLTELASAINWCWQGQYDEQIRLYTDVKKPDLDVKQLKLDLIIQAMVEDISHSAILFTANPDGLLNERVLVVGEGPGSDLVADQIPAITYYRHAQERIGYFENPYELDLIDDKLLLAFWDLADRIEELFGPGLDLELAVDRSGAVFLLQMRPVSNLNPSVYESAETVLDNSNIIESYPGLTLPLSTDFYHQAYRGVFEGLIKRLLPHPSEAVALRLNEVSSNMVSSWNGRAYYQLQNWLLLLRHLPFSKRIIPVWREMLGVDTLDSSAQGALLTVFARAKMALRLAASLWRIDYHYEQLKQAVEQIDAEFRLLEHGPFVGDLYEIFYQRIADTLLRHWDITLLNDLVAMVQTGRLKKKAALMGEVDVNGLISGITALASMKPLRSLAAIKLKLDSIDPALIAEAAEDDQLARLILSGEHPSLQADKSLEAIALMNEHLRLYGDRSIEELKLERHTQRSRPGLLFSALLDSRAIDLPTMHSDKETVWQPKLERLRRKAQLAIFRREESRLLRTRVYGIVRALFQRLGEELYQRKLLTDPADVFYLRTEEVFTAVARNENYTALVNRRQLEYEIYASLPAYARLIFAGKPFSKQKAGERQADLSDETGLSELRGTACSPGTVQGEVLILLDATKAAKVRGKILVSRNTDPGWVYLMLQATAIVAERGSVLSHTAIISRELGLPSVVGVKQATSLLRDGDLIEVDGSSGLIRILKRKKVIKDDPGS